jgi:hypothetical protein
MVSVVTKALPVIEMDMSGLYKGRKLPNMFDVPSTLG